MPERSLMARWFLIGGAILAAMGILLWQTLPIPLKWPPYLATASFAIVYGLGCLCWPARPHAHRKP